MPRTKDWRGQEGLGRREYTEAEYLTVVAAVRRHTENEATVKLADLLRDPVISGMRPGQDIGRPVRAIIADADGVEFVVYYSGRDALGVATSWEQAQGWSMHLLAGINTTRERVDRRNAWADEHLPRTQPVLFEGGC